MKRSELKQRTLKFSVAVVKLVQILPKTDACEAAGEPLVRCGTAVGAAYRAACIARNRYDFVARLGAVEEAVDESCYWFELICESGMLKPEQVAPLLKEGKSIKRIITKSRRVATKQFSRNPDFNDGLGDEDIPF